MLQPPAHASLRADAAAWFATLRDRLCAAFEAIEDEGGVLQDRAAGRFARTPWSRPGLEGGGTIGLMHGRVFEKVGVNVSVVSGEFGPELRATMPGAEEDPRFWAGGISVVAHPQSPHVPAAHMNTRMIVTTRGWFGGGGDITPMRPESAAAQEDAATFHAAFQAACDRARPGVLPGVQGLVRPLLLPAAPGGAARDWAASSTTTWHGRGPRTISPSPATSAAPSSGLSRHRAAPHGQPWTEADRDHQLVRRGRYVEFNLLHDRGTLFGLKTGGNVEAILMSMPPMVRWP